MIRPIFINKFNFRGEEGGEGGKEGVRGGVENKEEEELKE
jgi:hypothetical protein